MELWYIFLLSVIAISFPLSLVLVFWRPKCRPGGKLPPGNTGWPIVGESIEFLSTGWHGHPEKFFSDRISKFSSQVFRTSLMLEDTAVLCGPEGNKFLFTNENKLVRFWLPSSVNKIFPLANRTSKEEESIKFRKMLPSFFKPSALHKYVGTMDQITDQHFSLLWDNKIQVVVSPLTKQLTFWLACKIFLSIEDPVEITRLMEPFNFIMHGLLSIPIDLPGTAFRRGINAAKFISKELVLIIKQRKIDLDQGKASPMQDILSHMLSTSDENGEFMDEQEVADKILALLIGGHDTCSSVCACLVKYLGELPEIYAGVYKEQLEIAKTKAPRELLNWEDLTKMKYSWNVACEVLRLSPPLQGGFKEATAEFIYNGYCIPKGWKLYWSAYLTHKSPEFFVNPQKFDPSRFEGLGPLPYTYVPFGGGPRMCPGKEYARVQILVFMHHLVKRFKWENIIPDEKIVINPLPNPEKGLPIRLYPHKD